MLGQHTELRLTNARYDDLLMRVCSDFDGESDLVAFTFKLHDEDVKLSDDKGVENYFHLDKIQVSILINYLTLIHDNMSNPKD